MALGQSPLEKMVSGPNPAFWQGRRVFLTGHTGFKGGWLALWLTSMGAEVTAYALAPDTTPNLHGLARVGDAVREHIGDIRDGAALAAAMCSADPEVVFHLAAQALVRRGYREPLATLESNVMGTAHVLEAARTCPHLRAVVVVTSDKCYANQEWLWGYRETDPLGGDDPYSASKACAEIVSRAWRQSFFAEGAAIATVRAGNVIGGGDWSEDRLIPDAVRAFAAGQPITLRNPTATRPWQHALEALSGYLMLAERLVGEGRAWEGAWNFGPAEEDVQPVASVLDLFARAWGGDAHWQQEPGSQPHEAGRLTLVSSKSRGALGWRPRWGLQECIALTAAWYRAWLAGEDMRAVTHAQIGGYASSNPPVR